MAGCLSIPLRATALQERTNEATEGRNVTIQEETTAACLQYRRIMMPG